MATATVTVPKENMPHQLTKEALVKTAQVVTQQKKSITVWCPLAFPNRTRCMAYAEDEKCGFYDGLNEDCAILVIGRALNELKRSAVAYRKELGRE